MMLLNCWKTSLAIFSYSNWGQQLVGSLLLQSRTAHQSNCSLHSSSRNWVTLLFIYWCTVLLAVDVLMPIGLHTSIYNWEVRSDKNQTVGCSQSWMCTMCFWTCTTLIVVLLKVMNCATIETIFAKISIRYKFITVFTFARSRRLN